jgi:hypothetical protein
MRAAAIQAFNTAAMTRAKKLPNLDTILRKLQPPRAGGKRPQSVAQMEAAARLWTKAMGGRFKKGAAE